MRAAFVHDDVSNRTDPFVAGLTQFFIAYRLQNRSSFLPDRDASSRLFEFGRAESHFLAFPFFVGRVEWWVLVGSWFDEPAGVRIAREIGDRLQRNGASRAVFV